MSVAIMTFVTLAMASVVLVWSLGQTATSQSTFASAINANEAKAEERYTIEQVQFLANGQSGGGYACGTSTGSTGTASASGETTTTLVGGGTPGWGTDQWKRYFVTITGGDIDVGQTRTVVSNTPTTLTVTPAWTSAPDGTSTYSISVGCLVLYVRNVGSIQLVADAVYVNNQLALQTQYSTTTGSVIPAAETGTASATSTTTTLVDTTKSWTSSQWAGFSVTITGGDVDVGQTRLITGMTGCSGSPSVCNGLSVSPAWTTAPDTSSAYSINPGGTGPFRLSLGIQQLGSIAVIVPFPTSPGTTYTISVSTTRGSVVTVVQTY
jgi:hypothetical protein